MDFYEEICERLNIQLMKIVENFSKEGFKLNLNVKGEENLNRSYYFLSQFLLNGGKRLRPLLAILVAKAYGAEESDELYDAVLSIELVHNSTLVHDDFMDGDEWRRGKKTVHELCKGNYLKFKDEEYPNFKDKKCANAISEATILGNILCSKGFSLLGDSCFLNAQKALNDLIKTYVVINEGQILDFDSQYSDYYLDMAFCKTAVLFGVSARIGAYLAKAEDKEVFAVGEAILPAARAFQIQDDILDISDSREEKQGSDIKNGRVNFVNSLFFELATFEQKKLFCEKYFGKKNLDTESLNCAINFLKDSGVISVAEKKRDIYVLESIEKINRLKISEEYKKVFIDYIKLLAFRKK